MNKAISLFYGSDEKYSFVDRLSKYPAWVPEGFFFSRPGNNSLRRLRAAAT